MKLNLETYIALVGSVDKWLKIAYKDGKDGGTDNCDLCQHVKSMTDYIDCDECPIYRVTRRSDCRETPYDQWAGFTYWDDGYITRTIYGNRRTEALKAAEDMLIFLLDLEESVTHVDGERI